MPALSIIVQPEAVDEYLIKHKLEHGCVELDAMLLQHGGTESGAAAVLITFKMPGGRIVLGKTTLRLLSAAMGAINAALSGRGSGS